MAIVLSEIDDTWRYGFRSTKGAGFTVTIPGKPRPQGSLSLWRGSDGTERAKYPAEMVRHRNLVVGALAAAWGDQDPYPSAVEVKCLFMFARPKSHYRTGKNAAVLKDSAPRWVTTTPDVDKLLRLVGDALVVAGVLRDDSQIALVSGSKRYQTRDETRVSMWGLDL